MIRTIIFDLGRVIVPFEFSRGYQAMSALNNVAEQDIPERIRATGLVERFESGQVEPEDFARQLCSALDLKISYSDFCEIWSKIFHHETLIPEEFLERLHKRYRLLLLSNTNAIHYEMIERNYPLLRHMDHKVLSYKVGAMKPSPAIYREAIKHAQCAPEECFFTDDIPQYVEGARREGIDAVQFENYEQIQRELRARGVEW